MHLIGLVIFFKVFRLVVPYIHEKPIAEKIWPESCTSRDRILNDCNWCICNNQNQYVCTARVCREVDMFGLFKDTVQEHIVGMEGHGSWRSNATACQPRMHYQRDGLLCICDDDGSWPNPTCRDIFRVLHAIELTNRDQPSSVYKCTPRKLYLFGCNVCFCPATGRIDPRSCTANYCDENDPIFRNDEELLNAVNSNIDAVYAECELNRKYIIGCKHCVCLRNNRLICEENCREDLRSLEGDDLCSKFTPNQIFHIDCNTCTCDKNRQIYCTTKKCLREYRKPLVELSKTIDLNLRTVEPPLNGNECVPGTKYKDDCNTCFCSKSFSDKTILSCTLKNCKRPKRNVMLSLTRDCVENTVYESNCQICRCDAIDGVKRESCEVNPICQQNTDMDATTLEVSSLHGYCEPLHVYKNNCNTCQCLANGKIIECTSRICKDTLEKPIIVDLVPVSQEFGTKCGPYKSYKVDCNVCFCLSDGNVLCTTSKC